MEERDFRKIDFGYSSAEQEATRAPSLLIDGYVNIRDVCSQAIESSNFLILGYKGSGKSAVAERLRILNSDNSNFFLINLNLEDFPYASFSKIVSDSDSPESRYPTAWSWILLIYLLTSYENDAGALFEDTDAFSQTMNALREMGLTPESGLKTLIKTTTTTNTLKLTIPKILEKTWHTTKTVGGITDYVENLKRLIKSISSESKHIIVIDGLDEIVTSEAAQWDSLSALVFEVNRLNNLFAKENPSAKIILLCRTDFFELLAGANKNKIRQDSCVELNWYSDPAAPKSSMLVSAANLRTSLALGEATDLMSTFFPKKVFGRSTIKVLLDTTRHTPRDFLQPLKNIQRCCTSSSVTADQVKSGMRLYSIEYFLPEIIDELEGYCTSAEAKEFLQVVGALRSRDFSVPQLYEQINLEGNLITKEKADVILRALFECSAIGNVQVRTKGDRFLTFRFRNRHAPFNPKERILLHRGLWRALNLPVDSSWEDDGLSIDNK